MHAFYLKMIEKENRICTLIIITTQKENIYLEILQALELKKNSEERKEKIQFNAYSLSKALAKRK